MRIGILVGVVLAAMWSLPVAAQNSVTCESRDGGYRECYSGFRYPPVLVRQISSSACIEGNSWGHRPGSIWVSRGCRASFQEGRGGGVSGNSVVCESRDSRYVECRANFRGPVELVEQLSSSQCVEGSSWGTTRGGVWVDRGCRARFGEYYGGQGNQGDGYWEQEGDYSVTCESKNSRYNACEWDWDYGTPYLLEQLSNNPCVRGRSWGYDQRQQTLWVDQGCRAEFGAR